MFMSMALYSDAASSRAVSEQQQEEMLIEQPASPTAALWNSSANLDVEMKEEGSRRKAAKRNVCFAEDAKEHDGLTGRSAIFDRLITAYFVEQREISELDVLNLTGQNLTTVLELHQDLMDMAQRIAEAAEDGRTCAPVLPRGGGLCTKLCIPHLPYVRVLDRVVEAAANRLVKAQAAERVC